MLSKEESSERFEEADEDENGYLTWQEHVKETYGIDDPSAIDTTMMPEGDDTTRVSYIILYYFSIFMTATMADHPKLAQSN